MRGCNPFDRAVLGLSVTKHCDCDRFQIRHGIANLSINAIYNHIEWRKSSEHIVELRQRLDHRINYISVEIGILICRYIFLILRRSHIREQY